MCLDRLPALAHRSSVVSWSLNCSEAEAEARVPSPDKIA
jgi:hypothetical protein